MSDATRIPKTEITGLKGGIVKRFSKKMLGDVAKPVGVYWHNPKVLNFYFGLGQKSRKWDQCDVLGETQFEGDHRSAWSATYLSKEMGGRPRSTSTVSVTGSASPRRSPAWRMVWTKAWEVARPCRFR